MRSRSHRRNHLPKQAKRRPFVLAMKPKFLPAAFGLLLATTISSFSQVFVVPLPPEPVPPGPSTGPLTDASELIETFGDPAGNTLYVVKYTNSAGAGSSANPYDLWLLVSSKGAVLANKFFENSGSGTVIKIVSFTRQRILAQVDEGNGIVIEAFRPEGGDFVSEGIVLEDDVEGSASGADVESYSVQKPPRKFLDVGFKSGSKIFQIHRYDITKLKPSPAP